MKKIAVILFLIFGVSIHSQTDFSNRWEDFFSYNNVKDFIKIDDVIYALVDNAVFTYNTQNEELKKLSSIQGLSGETATAIHYNVSNKRLVIGYKNGLIEVVDNDNKITTSPEIINFNQTGEKQINDIFEHNNKLYLATPFAIVVYDIDKLEFGDTYFIGTSSSDEIINQINVFKNTIYATSPNGIYTADVNSPNLIDFNNWTKKFSGNYDEITVFNNKLYVSNGTNLQQVSENSIIQIRDFGKGILGLKPSNNSLSVTLNTSAVILDTNLTTKTQIFQTPEIEFNLNSSYEENGIVYLATKEFGILKTTTSNILKFEEIHPQGPLANDVFSVTANNKNVWVVYGGFTNTFAPSGLPVGYSRFNGEEWLNIRNTSSINMPNLVDVTINLNNPENVFIATFGSSSTSNAIETGGLLELENNQVKAFYNHTNSGLEDILPDNPSIFTIRISKTIFDREGNLWMTNIGAVNKIKKLTPSGNWKGYNISSVVKSFGLYEMAIDNNNSLWIGSRKDGVIVFNENGEKKRALNTQTNKGNLPNAKVRTVAIDKNNKVWIGTEEGLVVYNNASAIFNEESYNASPIIIEENGVGRKLMGDQSITSIVVDGANNKWFGTSTSGVVFTNPNGQNTLGIFNKENSPLPSNKINKIAVDDITGKVYFATDKGLVVYNSQVAPFGEELKEVYAYPNPALKKHNTVTIDGRKGTHLPKGTNIKILDVAGNLVYETNVVEGEQLQGGKAVWNKRNLAGKKVATGVYIVLLSTEDGTETSTTKIAIVN